MEQEARQSGDGMRVPSLPLPPSLFFAVDGRERARARALSSPENEILRFRRERVKY